MYLFETYSKVNTKICSWLIVLIFIFMISHVAKAADTIEIKAQHMEAEKNSIYEILFSINQQITPKAIMTVEFPTSFDLSGVLVAGSATINGGFNLSVEKNKVIIKRSGLGSIIKANQNADIKFANIRNPSNPSDTYKIKVSIKDDNNVTLIEKENIIRISSKK